MTTTPTTRRAGQPDPQREAAVDTDHHPLAYCEFCGVAVATPLTPCDDPLCQEQARELYEPFRRRQVAYCPWCGDPVAGLLTDCDKPDCVRRALDVEMAHVRREDV